MTVHFREHRKVTTPAGRCAAQHQFHRQSHFRICGCWLNVWHSLSKSRSWSGERRLRTGNLLQSHPASLFYLNQSVWQHLWDNIWHFIHKSKKLDIIPQKAVWSKDWLGLPGGTAPSVHFCFHMIQNISQRVLHHSAPAHVAHLQEEQKTNERLQKP